jgi:hypothetical protein
MIKLKNNQLNKRHKKQPELTRVNLLSIILVSRDQDILMKNKQNKNKQILKLDSQSSMSDLMLNDENYKNLNKKIT